MIKGYKIARAEDAALLTELTIAFAHEIAGPIDAQLQEQFKARLLAYYPAAIANGTIICWYAIVGDEPAGIASINIREQYPTLKNLSGRAGYLFNVYTVPRYRKMGISSTLVKQAVDSVKQLGITAFELHATPDGEPVYIKQGFSNHAEPTYRMYADE